MRIAPWADGFLFGAGIVPVVFGLKVLCGDGPACFADPFLVIAFSPLALPRELGFAFPGNTEEIAYLIVFWAIVSSVAAHLVGKLWKHRSWTEDSF